MKKFLNYTLKCILVIILLVSLPVCMSLCVERATTIATIPHKSQLKEGDIIFHYSNSQQSKLITVGTQSYITLCGIIVFRNGEPMVYEATKTVRLTPLKKFINRARDGKVWIKRTNFDVKKIKTNYIGMPYDIQFKFNNNKMYC